MCWSFSVLPLFNCITVTTSKMLLSNTIVRNIITPTMAVFMLSLECLHVLLCAEKIVPLLVFSHGWQQLRCTAMCFWSAWTGVGQLQLFLYNLTTTVSTGKYKKETKIGHPSVCWEIIIITIHGFCLVNFRCHKSKVCSLVTISLTLFSYISLWVSL